MVLRLIPTAANLLGSWVPANRICGWAALIGAAVHVHGGGVRLMPVKLCIWAGSAHKVSTYSVCIWARGNVTEYKRETRPARSKAHLRNGCFLFILIVLLVSVLNLPLGRFIHWELISIELVEDHGVLSCSRPDSPFVLLGKSIQVTLPRA